MCYNISLFLGKLGKGNVPSFIIWSKQRSGYFITGKAGREISFYILKKSRIEKKSVQSNYQ